MLNQKEKDNLSARCVGGWCEGWAGWVSDLRAIPERHLGRIPGNMVGGGVEGRGAHVQLIRLSPD